MRLCRLFKPSVLAGLLWHHANGKTEAQFHYCQPGLCFPLSRHSWPSREGCLVVIVWVWDCRLTTSFYWHHPNLGEECLPLTWPPLTPWAWGGVGLLALGRKESSGFPLHPHWFYHRGEGGTVSPGWIFRLTTLPLLSGVGSVTVLSMVFGCTKDRGYCLKVFCVSRLPLFLSFGLRE